MFIFIFTSYINIPTKKEKSSQADKPPARQLFFRCLRSGSGSTRSPTIN